jgi:zinc protease
MRMLLKVARDYLFPTVVLLQSVSPILPAVAAEERVSERVFLVHDKPGTSTQFQMIVTAGCIDEAGGQCRGLAHYLEHLVLTGRNPEHTDIAVRFFADGYANGWTNQRATVFVHSFPPRQDGPKVELEKLFTFYAARLKDFSISDADASRERNVVLQEHDWRVGSRPFERFARTLRRALLPDHPAGQWTIGTREEIEAFTVDQAKAFHHAWYAPNNVYFVVKAGIDGARLKEIADNALVGLEPRQLPPRASLQAPEVVRERKSFRQSDRSVRQPAVYFEKLVTIAEPDRLASRAARTIVTNFLTSRLPGSPYDALADKEELAAGQPSVRLERVAPKCFVLSVRAAAAKDVAPEKLMAAIEAYVDTLATQGISADSIARLKTRYLEARAIAEQDPNQVYARLANWLASRGRYEDLAAFSTRIAEVSPADVAAILRGLSGPGRVVTGTLVPAAEEPKL